MVLDIELFRSDKGCNLENVKENQKKRYQDVSLVERVAEHDAKWRKCCFTGDKYKALRNLCSKEISFKLKQGEVLCEEESEELSDDFSINTVTPELLKLTSILQIKKISAFIDGKIKENQCQEKTLQKLRDTALAEIGNILHTSVPISDSENDNEVVFTCGVVSVQKPYSHVDLIQMIAGVDTRGGTTVAGGRGYFLKGPCVLLQTALVQMAIHKWAAKGYQPIYTPFFMRKEIMQEVAQLSQFDEELYKVVGKSSDATTFDEEKYLIATSEQPLAALHRNEWLLESSLPIRYIGQSTCFRQEVGSHGRDTGGIFRVHQFEKIEQFVLTSPNNNKSWEMMEEMMNNCKEFYNDLGISYRVVNIVSGALNLSAAKKLDLEAWFPGSKAYRELVSCSNCLDYQSRRLLVRYGQQKTNKGTQQFVHMLNSTACATTRVICAILETYQTENGIKIPKILKKYFPPDYPDVIPFTKETAPIKNTQK